MSDLGAREWVSHEGGREWVSAEGGRTEVWGWDLNLVVGPRLAIPMGALGSLPEKSFTAQG